VGAPPRGMQWVPRGGGGGDGGQAGGAWGLQSMHACRESPADARWAGREAPACRKSRFSSSVVVASSLWSLRRVLQPMQGRAQGSSGQHDGVRGRGRHAESSAGQHEGLRVTGKQAGLVRRQSLRRSAVQHIAAQGSMSCRWTPVAATGRREAALTCVCWLGTCRAAGPRTRPAPPPPAPRCAADP